jgi:hypothetical protein
MAQRKEAAINLAMCLRAEMIPHPIVNNLSALCFTEDCCSLAFLGLVDDRPLRFDDPYNSALFRLSFSRFYFACLCLSAQEIPLSLFMAMQIILDNSTPKILCKKWLTPLRLVDKIP